MKPGAKRIALTGCAALVALAAGSTVAYTPARTFELRTAKGRPISDATIGYYHASSIFNFVDSLTRYHPGRLIAPDANGEVRVPARLSWKRPLDLQPEVRIKFIYVPELHNALQIGPDASSLPNVVDIDGGHRTMTFRDLSGDPELWHRSLGNLHSVVRFDLWPDPSGRHSRTVIATRAQLDALVSAIEREYVALRERFQDAPRALPSEASIAWWPPEEREERLARVEAQLAREPLWGPYLERLWAKDIASLKRDWAQLRP